MSNAAAALTKNPDDPYTWDEMEYAYNQVQEFNGQHKEAVRQLGILEGQIKSKREEVASIEATLAKKKADFQKMSKNCRLE
jgi:chromosome segregation ATPase